jgi:hypothetical protein
MTNPEIGKRYTYYPDPENKGDNLHFPAIVEDVGRRVRVRVFMNGAEVVRYVSPKKLEEQLELFS